MKRGAVVVILLVSVSFAARATAHQSAPEAVTSKTIDVGTARPVLRAIELFRERYHVAITYEEPRYMYAGDLEDISYLHKGSMRSGTKLIAPRGREIHFQYLEANGKPQEGMQILIGRLLAEYTEQGGEVFEVREWSAPNGPEWSVIAKKARNQAGIMVDQTDVLGTPVSIPKAQRSASEFITAILQQVRNKTGYDVAWSALAGKPDMWTGDFGADNIPARDALSELLGRSQVPIVWDMNYDPESGRYFLTFVWTPQPPEPLNAYRVPPDVARTLSVRPGYIPPGAALRQTLSPQGVTALQLNLAQRGYYAGKPTGKMNAKTADALKKFQVANNLAVTGRLDRQTIHKLGLDTSTSQH